VGVGTVGPDLTRAERFTLIRDALERLDRQGIRIRLVRDQPWIPGANR
jgi:hypothetical protein